jgi:hypothetical protein
MKGQITANDENDDESLMPDAVFPVHHLYQCWSHVESFIQGSVQEAAD